MQSQEPHLMMCFRPKLHARARGALSGSSPLNLLVLPSTFFKDTLGYAPLAGPAFLDLLVTENLES